MPLINEPSQICVTGIGALMYSASSINFIAPAHRVVGIAPHCHFFAVHLVGGPNFSTFGADDVNDDANTKALALFCSE